MLERPRKLRLAPTAGGGRRIVRRVASPWSPARRAKRTIGRVDQRLLLALRTRRHSAALDRAVGALGSFGELGAGWAGIGLCGALLHAGERERWVRAAAAAPVAILANYSVKLTIGRQRPLIDDHPPLARAPSKLSFPSAHSTSAVAAATVLGRVAPGARPALYGLAAAICVGRPYLGMHYPSDVLAGVVLGAAIGRVYPLPAACSHHRPTILPPEPPASRPDRARSAGSGRSHP